MKIKIRKIYRELHLSEYFGEGDTDKLEVWVNIPRSLREEYSANADAQTEFLMEISRLAKEDRELTEEKKAELSEQMPKFTAFTFEWLSKIWKWNGSHPSAEEVKALAEGLMEQDLTLWRWLVAKTWMLINEHTEISKKGRPTSS